MLRVGFIDYLNCLPLRLGLEATGGLEGVELVGGTPAEVNAALLSGEVELGLVSSASWARNRDRLMRLEGYGSESATSHSLARLVLERVHGASPLYEVVSMRPEWVLDEYDAALFIGDTALRVRCMGGVEVYDLGEAWERLAGLPMVYAVWASRRDSALCGFWRVRVARAVSWAGEHLDELVAEARCSCPAAEGDLRTYFSSCIGYKLGAREEEGLERYLSEGGLLTSRVYGKVSA